MLNFYAPNALIRPIRLSETTRRFAYESLDHKYGMDTKKTMAVSLDDITNIENYSPIQKYDAAIEKIAREAPIRICDGELISGAATLGLAISHRVPATLKNEPICSSISHLTIDFETVLKYGVNSLIEKAEISLRKYKGTEKEPFAKSAVLCLDAFKIWHARYLSALKNKKGYEENYKNLTRVPFEPAQSFYEAVQSLWFTFAFVRLCGNWPGIGRLDYLLGDYLENDLKNGILTLDEAREILAHFFIKGCEWICGGNYGSGDAQHYQNILLAGIDENGNEITNAVTYLTLDILEELGISDFPTTVRINKNTDEKLLDRISEVMRFGGGILAIYNEDLIIDALVKDGYPIEEARKFSNDGCWEVQIPGKTYFIYIPFDSLQILQHQTLKGYCADVSFDDFDALYEAFATDLHATIEAIYNARKGIFANAECTVWKSMEPCTVVSLFEQGCIEKGLSYLEGGPIYNLFSPHIGGLADTANSLYAIKKLVFDDKKLSFGEFMKILADNWEGNENLRLYALNKYSYYGNDNDEVDMIAARILKDLADFSNALDGRCGYHFPAGVSTFGRQLEWAPKRLASAHGKKAGDILAANCSPTPGTDREGATSIIRSYCKADLGRLVSGAALDIKLLPTSVAGEDGICYLSSLIKSFVALGGFFMQPDVVDSSILREAQENPENYQTLSVRVSGWNARFVTLNKCWQDMVIEQTEK